jgi:hypothetical protein
MRSSAVDAMPVLSPCLGSSVSRPGNQFPVARTTGVTYRRPVHPRRTTFFIERLPRSACSYRGMALHARATEGPAWSGTSDVTFSFCLADRLVGTSQGNGTWGPGAGHERVSTR